MSGAVARYREEFCFSRNTSNITKGGAMKASILLCVLAAILIAGCASPKSSPIEGAWKLVHVKWVTGDSIASEFPGTLTGSDMKMWSRGHFAFVGRFKSDTTFTDNYGGGRYRLDGNRYEEIIQYHSYASMVGDTVKMLLEVRNDTLIQVWPVGADGKIDKKTYAEEKYIRLD